MFLEGQLIDHYALQHIVGRGGAGEVYVAEDVQTPHQLAVKVVRNVASSQQSEQIRQNATRIFQQEMSTLASLKHPLIVAIYKSGETSIEHISNFYTAMPYFSEGSLDDWLHRRNASDLLTAKQVSYFVSQVASTLQVAHDHQIIHQGIKPSNILVRSSAKGLDKPDMFVSDFGITRFKMATGKPVYDTHAYMAPEQWRGEPVAATDQYALAIMAYYLLTGRLPFIGDGEQLRQQHAMVTPPPPSMLNQNISRALDVVLLRALEKKPADRFESISQFANAFEQALSQHVSDSPTPAMSQEKLSQTPITKAAKSQKRRSDIAAILIVALVVVIIAASVFGVSEYQKQVNNYLAKATTQTRASILDHPFPAYMEGKGSLSLYDSLNNPFDWSNEAGSGGSCQFNSDEYIVTVTQPSTFLPCFANKAIVPRNFAFEVQMQVLQGDCGGMIFRGDPSNNYAYIFEVCQDGTCSLLLTDSNSMNKALIKDYGVKANINTGTYSLNTIGVVANNDLIILYVNGEEVGRTHDGSLNQGRIGLMADYQFNATQVSYINALVWTLQ